MTIQEENQKNDIRFLFSATRKTKNFMRARDQRAPNIMYQSQGSIEVDLFQKDEARRSLITTTLWEGQLFNIKRLQLKGKRYNTIPLTHECIIQCRYVERSKTLLKIDFPLFY